MSQSVRRWLFSAGAVAAVGASAFGMGWPASAAPVAPAGPGIPGAAAAAAAAAASTYVPPSHALSYGQSGAAVKSVQKRLNQLHYYAGPADGQYGQDLQEAAWAFREAQGLGLNNNSALEPITRTFLHDLIHPRLPAVIARHYLRKGQALPANRIEVNQTTEVLVLYRNNQPHLILHVSSGGRYYYCNQGSCGYAVTPDGQYTALSYLAGDIRVPLGFMENPVFFIGRAYAIHGGDPVPWYAASHGCIRIYNDAVNWFHKEVSVGGKHPEPIFVGGRVRPYPDSN
jgi:lipoprotein-anchoring transpeptidase ErfK/SrfK